MEYTGSYGCYAEVDSKATYYTVEVVVFSKFSVDLFLFQVVIKKEKHQKLTLPPLYSLWWCGALSLTISDPDYFTVKTESHSEMGTNVTMLCYTVIDRYSSLSLSILHFNNAKTCFLNFTLWSNDRVLNTTCQLKLYYSLRQK